MSKIRKDKKNLASKISDSIRGLECNLKDKQHAELLEIVKAVNKTGSHVIEELCLEGDRLLNEENNELWKQDVLERLEYDKDQRRNSKYKE